MFYHIAPTFLLILFFASQIEADSSVQPLEEKAPAPSTKLALTSVDLQNNLWKSDSEQDKLYRVYSLEDLEVERKDSLKLKSDAKNSDDKQPCDLHETERMNPAAFLSPRTDIGPAFNYAPNPNPPRPPPRSISYPWNQPVRKEVSTSTDRKGRTFWPFTSWFGYDYYDPYYDPYYVPPPPPYPYYPPPYY